jgi:hypothetical protein
VLVVIGSLSFELWLDVSNVLISYDMIVLENNLDVTYHAGECSIHEASSL